VLEHALLLGSACLGAFLQLNAKLGIFACTHAALFLVTLRALFSQAGFLSGLQSRFLFLASLLRCGFGPPPCVFSRPEPCLFFSRDPGLLKRMQLQELVRE
jgi:hypothetical protein